jgi:hypothetical protein
MQIKKRFFRKIYSKQPNRIITEGNSPLFTAWRYTRIEPEAGGAARRIYRNDIPGNRRRDGREGEWSARRGRTAKR